ncbi:DNA phosphorothioation-dependent restriction protein DptH [Sporomusa termitida]|uniref:DNA phosphorothioation-dependent restriction protein DptH n=1 Tax=Sporomusa termitida TaxID=2377 RepID=A0A517DWR1_9FIRM|nr:DNA phosphorothioation-dependent restriction protein DptH [Sporomusa termitida]QDR81801.1 DNA phosphorothioation-dependent restriction protein DptH [Sporomusa termitida]
MSKQFYDYLSNLILKYFDSHEIKPGDKFHIQFEKEEQVSALYASLSQANNVTNFIYLSANKIPLYNSCCLIYKDVSIIIATTINDVKPDFLTMLRNKVGIESEPQFRNSAILFIHDTTLDSIIKGTASFQKSGMPLHVKSIISDIKSKLKLPTGILKRHDRFILHFALDQKNNSLIEDNTSIFEYETILDILYTGKIKQEQYKDFGLFFDAALVQATDDATYSRMQDNYNLFMQIDTIHKYGNPDIELEKFFDEKGVDLLKTNEWHNLDYKEVKNSATRKKEFIPITYKESKIAEALTYWERPDGESKVKSRIRNIIIFNEEKQIALKLELFFNDYIKSSNLKSDGDISISNSGKRLLVNLIHKPHTTTFSKVIYKEDNNNIKLEFKIAIVECSAKVLEQIKTKFSIYMKGKDNFIHFHFDENEFIFNPSGVIDSHDAIDSLDSTFEIDDTQKLILKKAGNFDIVNEDSDYIKINLIINSCMIPLAIEDNVTLPTVITGISMWKKKRELQLNFEYQSNKLIQRNHEYFARDDFRKNLEREKFIIETGALHFTELGEELFPEDVEIAPELKGSYERLIQYYQITGLTPSLAHYDDSLVALTQDYITEYIKALSSIENGTYITSIKKDLTKIGVITKLDGEQEILLTPLHPLMVAYQLLINNKIGNEELPDELLKKLNPAALLPYIHDYNGKLYKPMEQTHSPEWLLYVDSAKQRYKGSRNFVAKLVQEKIEEFMDHFSYLFNLTSRAPIKISLVNLGDCKEILQGIFFYYISALRKNPSIENLITIELYIYSELDSINAFEEISFYDDISTIKETFNLTFSVGSSNSFFTEEDILNIFREKVYFFKKHKKEDIYEYVHITFYEMNQDTKGTSSNMEDISTGVALAGIVSGIPSIYLGDSYRTGFGTKHLEKINDTPLLIIATLLNALERVIASGDPFDNKKCITTAIFEDRKKSLDKVYDTSHWITFIDPKVDLNFFKSDFKTKDLLIIHYSDQYTSSSGYDAITVTRKSKQYQMIIEEFLHTKQLNPVDTASAKIIDFFNAINGKWLLRLISSKNQMPREKLSILSAIKISLAYFYHPDIIWVPISLEEILRVSGGAGLSKNGGLFSIKNLKGSGNYSDDILLIGVHVYGTEINVYYYPIEVKIGNNALGVKEKAVEQANKTRDLIEKFLIETENESNPMTKKLYRNFLVQLMIVSAEKMKLYNIWPEQNWDMILNSTVRAQLLNDSYTISSDHDIFIGRGAVLSFKKDIYFNEHPIIKDNILILEFSEQAGYNHITINIEELKNKFLNGKNDFDPATLFCNTFRLKNKPEALANVSESGSNNDNHHISSAVFLMQQRQKTAIQPLQVVFGTQTDTSQPLIWYPTDTNKTSHTNTGIIGTMGTGKTQFTKSLITQLYQNQHDNVNSKPIGILIFDYKGDYVDENFRKATNATILDLFHLPYNPLALFVTKDSRPLLPLHTANMLKETISNAFHLGPKQEMLLREIIMDTYERQGIKKAVSSTWTNPPPTLNDVFGLYFSREDIKEDVLYASLRNLADFELFEPDVNKTKPLFDIITGVTVIKLSGYDESIQNLVVAISLDILYTQMLIAGESETQDEYRQLTKMILVDEADNFLSKNFNSLKKLLKEGRMFGVGTILSTQFLSHFSTTDNDYANYISTWVVHNVSDLNAKDIKYIFNTSSKVEEDNISSKIKRLEKHQSLIKFPHINKPLHCKDKPFWQLIQESVDISE